jgi:hypothetical protein
MGLGSQIKAAGQRGMAAASVRMCESELRQCERELSAAANLLYRQTYLGDYYRASLLDVIDALQFFERDYLSEWERRPNFFNPNASGASFEYAHKCVEGLHTHSFLGLTRALRPRNTIGRIVSNLDANERHPTRHQIPYLYLFAVAIHQTPGSATVAVTSQVTERIDPMQTVACLRNGLFEAPSMLASRYWCTMPETLRSYLHGTLREHNPDLQSWFSLPSTQNLPEIAVPLHKVRAAQVQLAQAQANYAQIVGGTNP